MVALIDDNRPNNANNAPKKVFRQRLIFSVESFANSVEVMQNALQGLVDAGAVRLVGRQEGVRDYRRTDGVGEDHSGLDAGYAQAIWVVEADHPFR